MDSETEAFEGFGKPEKKNGKWVWVCGGSETEERGRMFEMLLVLFSQMLLFGGSSIHRL